MKSKVYHLIPWDSTKNIGKSYNQMMSLIDDNDWACFLDGDAVHTSPYFGKRIEDVINSNPTYSFFTCYTNRVACKYQVAPGSDWNSNDWAYHRKLGDQLWNKNTTNVVNITKSQLLSGVLILVKKSAWQSVGGFLETGMLGVDNDLHKKFKNAGLKVGLMTGIYVQHWYRGGNIHDKKHLI